MFDISLSRRTFLAASTSVALSLAVVAPTLAQQAATPVHVNVDRTKLAIKGYDPVAYFTPGKPTPGKADITAEYDGAVYRFASEDNRKLFQADPAKYVPQYGGFCAQAVIAGQKVEIDPTAFKVVDGKLYLNFSHAVNRGWVRDAPKNIQIGNTQWQRIKDIPANRL